LLLLFKLTFENRIVITVIVEDAGDPLWVVDEGIEITLKCPDAIVSA